MLNTLLRLERRARRQPKDAAVHCALAELQLQLGNTNGAIATIRHVLTIETPPTTLVRLGHLLERIDDDPEALAAYERATADARCRIPALVGQGRVLMRQGRTVNATRVLSKAVWLAPEDVEARCALAGALIQESRLDEAGTQLRQAIDVDATHLPAWQLLARIGEASGDLDGEVAALRGALRCAPDLDLSITLAHRLEALGRTGEAIELLTRAAEHFPSAATLLSELGRCQHADGRAAATETLRQASQMRGAPMETLFWLGRAHQAADDHVAARQAFRTAQARGMRTPPLYCGLAWSLQQLGDHAAAIDVLVQGLMQHRGEAQIQSLLAEVQRAAPQFSAGAESASDAAARGHALEGRLQDFSVVDLLEFLRLNRRTGALRLAASQGVAEILLIEGNLASASNSNTAPLGDRLLAAGVLTGADLDTMMTGHETVPLGRRLVESKRIELAALKRALHGQAQETISEILRWTDGHFVFQTDYNLRKSIPVEYELNTAQILLDALCLMDEEGAGLVS